jgi:hypothetical protein
MDIDFVRLAGGRHEIAVRNRRKGPDVRHPPAPVGSRIPHDLVHAAVESALGIRDGFWGAIDAGATFGGFEPRSGAKVLRRKGPDVLAAELPVNWAYRVWTGRSVEAADGVSGRRPLADAQLGVALAALDDAARRWDATPEGSALSWRW